jgi:hypothetical protein
MSGLIRLSEKARRAVVKALAPAEPIVFVTSPDARESARAALPTLAAGALIAGLSAPIAWACFHAAWVAFSNSGSPAMALVFGCFALPTFLLGLYLMLAPLAAYRKAQDSVMLVTDRRLVTISVKGGVVQALPARAILGVERKNVERGFGTLEIRHEARGDEAETVLAGIDNIMEAEFAIRRMTLDHSITIISPVH